MVSHRQKLVRKRYKEEHAELFPKPEVQSQHRPKTPTRRSKRRASASARKKIVKKTNPTEEDLENTHSEEDLENTHSESPE
ncbi:hypothetical protein Acr_03g0001130 [Actinidia rufa]|uniref:Uncharacterized protein n=1 Tax=Actinidia rufa TaxID=165716 RepID=A0A7J0EBP8_9ERIC|nr:hypothetical protein Acr_03g0001130 [Actinidia rufa]